MRSFKSNENIHKKEGGSYYVVSANKASTVTLQSPSNESQRKHCNFANFKWAADSKTDIKAVKIAALQNLNTHYLDNDLHRHLNACTILDPRYKDMPMQCCF